MEVVCERSLQKGLIQFERISLILSDLYPSMKCYKTASRKAYVLGSPIYRDRADTDELGERLLSDDIPHFIREINGSFLIILYDTAEKRLTVANDRFASVYFFYRVDDGIFTGATNYSDIWQRFRGKSGFTIDEEAFYAFVSMSRLFGNETYDRDTAFLDSASIMTYSTDSGTLAVERYWQPDCTFNNLTLRENAERLAYLIKQSFRRLTSDSKRYGILLSGGLDSRIVLAASDKPLACFTTCGYKNNEYLVAGKLSKVKGYEHVFIQKSEAYYADIIDRATYLASAMSNYTNAHFFNIEEAVKRRTDVLLHGYGFDFLFRGKYLPCTAGFFMKRFTYKRNLADFSTSEKDLAEEFIERVSYRLKSIDPALLVKYPYRKKMVDSLYSQIKKIVDESKTFSGNTYQWWDYCLFKNISRHYTWLNLLSVRSFVEERTVAFDNDLLDLFWSLKPEFLLNGSVFLEALKLLDPAICTVRYANTNLKIDETPITTAVKLIVNKILKETKLNRVIKRSIPPPSLRERSWPIDADSIRDDERIRKAALGLRQSGAMEELRFIDMDRVSSCVKDHLTGKADHSSLILNLITIDKFLAL